MFTKSKLKKNLQSSEDIENNSRTKEGNRERLSKNSIVIEPTNFMSSLNPRAFWDYRELIYFLALRDLKIRYKQTFLGIAWVLLQPLLTTVIFTAIFLRIGGHEKSDIPYALVAFSGFSVWTFVNSAITNSSNSLINHSTLITKVYFPRLIIPVAAVAATLVDLVFGLAGLLVMILIYQIPLSWQIVFLPLLILPILFLSLGIGIITAAQNVKYRDVKYILPVALQLFLFASPVFYSLSMLSEGTTWMWQLNPLTGILENFRALIFRSAFDWSSFAYSALFSLILFLLAVYVFHRMEDDFADVI
jgi:lipopolysaccharide transport system permease protein